MVFLRWVLTTAAIVCAAAAADKRQAPNEGDFADRSSDGSYAFRYGDRNQFHSAAANKNNVVSGSFGSRSPETGRIVQTSYSAGPRGFRARGPDVARQTDLSQVRSPYAPPVPTDSSKYDPAYDRYYDPNEDPSYKFTVRTPTQSKSETADSRGHVEGAYSYLDDVGKRHDVQYEAGAGTGFHVKSAHPDSDTFGGVFYNGPPGKPGGQPRGHSSVVLGKDGSYGFTASGPDQRRTEVSDASGRVRGSYTYVDDKGVQRTVQYVAGPEIGYRVVNNAAAGGAAAANLGVPVPALLPSGSVVSVTPPSLLSSSPSLSSSVFPSSILPSSILPLPSSTPLTPSSFEQDLFGPASVSSTSAPPSDRRRPESQTPFKGGGSEEFLSPNSAVPLGSAFPEDDPRLPPKNWPPTVYKNKDEESFFQPFQKVDKRREQQQQHGPSSPADSPFGGVPDSSYGGSPRPSVAVRPTSPSYTLYGQPSRPIVVQDGGYGQYGGTDYQKQPAEHSEFSGRLPPGTVVKARVQSLDILPFGYRVPSPSYVFEKQFGGIDGYQNSIEKK